MPLRIHFISGLPRSGSTLLAAILRQNPCFQASMSGPVADIFRSILHSMSTSETALFVTDEQRERVLRGAVESYYADVAPGRVIFDTNRGWCALLPSIARLFQGSKVICCLRNPAWIMDSVERRVQSNPLQTSKMFNGEATNVVARVEHMKSNFLGVPLNALRQAWFGEDSQRLIGIRYDSLTARPNEVIGCLYDELGVGRYPHDFENLEYDEPEFDARLNMPGLHRVARRVEARKRETVLPPDLFKQHDGEFWEMPGQNPRHVLVL